MDIPHIESVHVYSMVGLVLRLTCEDGASERAQLANRGTTTARLRSLVMHYPNFVLRKHYPKDTMCMALAINCVRPTTSYPTWLWLRASLVRPCLLARRHYTIVCSLLHNAGAPASADLTKMPC